MHGPESKLLQTTNRERSKMQMIAYTRALGWCYEFFSPEVKNRSPVCTGTAFPFLSNAIRVTINQFTEKLKTLNRRKELSQKREQKWPSLVLFSLAHVYEALSPWKNLEGWPICSLHKKSWFLVPANEMRVRSLVSWERNYVYVIMTYHTLSCLTACDTTSLEPVSSPLYPNGSNPSLLQ